MTKQAGQDAKSRFMEKLVRNLNVKQEMYKEAFSHLDGYSYRRRSRKENNKPEALKKGLAKVRELLQLAKLPRGNTFEAELTLAIDKKLDRKEKKAAAGVDFLAARSKFSEEELKRNLRSALHENTRGMIRKLTEDNKIKLGYSHSAPPFWYSKVYLQGIAVVSHKGNNLLIDNALPLTLTPAAVTYGVVKAWSVVTHEKIMAVVVKRNNGMLAMSFLDNADAAMNEAAYLTVINTARGTQCADCKACDGARGGAATSFWIGVHGTTKKRHLAVLRGAA